MNLVLLHKFSFNAHENTLDEFRRKERILNGGQEFVVFDYLLS